MSLMDNTLKGNTALVTVFVHEMHNKLAVIRSSAGLMEVHSAKTDEYIQNILKQHISQIHETLDDLSSRIMELSLFMRLNLSEDELESETDLHKLMEQVQDWFDSEKGKSLNITGHFDPVRISMEHAEIAYMSIVKLALFFARDIVDDINISRPFPGAMKISFPGSKLYSDDFKKLDRYLKGDHQVELHSALMSIYLSNKIIKSYYGKLTFNAEDEGRKSFIIQLPLA